MNSLSVVIVVLAAAALVATAVLYWYLSQPSGQGAGVAPRRERLSSPAGTSRFQESQPTRPLSTPRAYDKDNEIASTLERLRSDVDTLVSGQTRIEKMLGSLIDREWQNIGPVDTRNDAPGHSLQRGNLNYGFGGSTRQKAAATSESRAAKVKRIVIAYCNREIATLDDLVDEAKRF